MYARELKERLAPSALERLAEIAGPHRGMFYRVAAALFNQDNVSLLEEFIFSDEAGEFLSRRRNSSESRLEDSLYLLLHRISREIPPGIIAAIAGEMSRGEFIRLERSFYLPPVDEKGFRMVEKGFVQVGEQNLELLELYLEFCLCQEFTFLKQAYEYDRSLLESVFEQLLGLLLARRNLRRVRQAALTFNEHSVRRLMERAREARATEELSFKIFEIFHKQEDPETFFKYLKVLNRRYAYRSSEQIDRNTGFYYQKARALWPVFLVSQEEGIPAFKAFLKEFGKIKDDLNEFLWEVLLDMPPEKATGAMSVLASTSFLSIHRHYATDRSILKLLVKNIVTALLELNIRGFDQSLFGLILKLLMGLKVDRGFLKRRGDFFKWLGERSSSLRLESELIRFLFFEYIYIALKLTPNERGMKMIKYCDENHKFFVAHLDGIYGDSFRMRERTADHVFKPLLERLRKITWGPVRERFVDEVEDDIALALKGRLEELIVAACELDQEDRMIAALLELPPEELENYHIAFMDVYRTDLNRIDEAIVPDFWYRLDFARAIPFCREAVFPLVGAIEMKIGEGGAYTDGRTIFLPEYVNYFKDPPLSGEENRNLTWYIGLALHEAGHLVAGTFRFNFVYYMNKLESPGVFKAIYNVFEDYRIEEYLIRLRVHMQIADILNEMNTFILYRSLNRPSAIAAEVLFQILEETTGINEGIKTHPLYLARLSRFENANVNLGRFRDLDAMINYGVGRLKNLVVGNPLAVLPLAREFYEIIKHWPLEALEELSEPATIPFGIHENENPGRPLNQEELEGLYRAYNQNPREFMGENNLPVYPELHGEDKTPVGERAERSRGNLLPPSERELTREMLRETIRPGFEHKGTIDFSTRTTKDNIAARDQLAGTPGLSTGLGDKSTPGVGGLKDAIRGLFAKNKKENESGKQTSGGNETGVTSPDGESAGFVYSLDSATGSRTRLSEIREFRVSKINRHYMQKFKKWEYLAEKVYRKLAALLPENEEEMIPSSFSGDINMDRLVEILSRGDALGIQEFLDEYHTQGRSLDTLIGLDISGSTSLIPARGIYLVDLGDERRFKPEELLKYDTVIDIEKAFALILGRALSYLTRRVAVLGFNSVTSTNVYRATTLEAVSSFQYGYANRDGDFIRYATRLLNQGGCDVRYFFMISDGQPTADNYEGRDALEDTLIAMREAKNQGVTLVYFNVDEKRGEYFEAFKREASYAEYFARPEDILDSISDLVTAVANTLR